MPQVSPTGETLLYLLNHTDQTAKIPLPQGTYQDLLTGQSLRGELTLAKYGAAILAQ